MKPATNTQPSAEDFPGLALFADLCKVEPERLREVLSEGCDDEEDVALVERFRAFANLTTNPKPFLAWINKIPPQNRSQQTTKMQLTTK